MNFLLYFLVFEIFLFEYLHFHYGVGSVLLTWTPELVSIAMLVFVSLNASALKIDFKYTVWFVIFIAYILAGLVVNQVPVGAIILGLRGYFKYVPLFLLPLIGFVSDGRARKFLWVILIISLLQVPVAAYQRFVEFRGLSTGDVVTGTMSDGPAILSIFMMMVIAMLSGFFAKKIITLKTFLVVSMVLLFPTMINETKGTLFLLPLAVLIPIYAVKSHENIKNTIFGLLPVLLVLVVLLGVFVSVYDKFYTAVGSDSLLGFLSSDAFQTYTYNEDIKLGEKDEIGRGNAFVWVVTALAKDPYNLLMGLGMGNISYMPAMGIMGDYAIEYSRFGVDVMAINIFLAEFGILGIILFAAVLFMLYRDAKACANRAGQVGAIAAGWAGIVFIMALSLFYKNIIHANSIGYLFAFGSGYIVTLRMKKVLQKQQASEIDEVLKDGKSNDRILQRRKQR